MKAVGILKMCQFETNAQNARALEVMIPCHNNAATCYIKLKNFGDARLLSENVSAALFIACLVGVVAGTLRMLFVTFPILRVHLSDI